MTQEQAIQKAKIESNVDEVIKEIFDYFKTNEAGLRRRLDRAMDTLKVLQMKEVNYKRGVYKKTPKVCRVCLTDFLGTEKAKYCSNKCACKKSRENRIKKEQK